MPKPCELRQIAGAMWAKLDIDWDGGPMSLYTDNEIEDIKKRVRTEIIYAINNLDRITYEEIT